MAFYQNQYGNPYMNYGYQPQQYQIQQPVVQQPMIQQTPSQSQQPQTLFGKIVDCYETAKSQDVPIGMSGVYPQADGSAVFIKTWNSDGTTKTSEYKLVEESTSSKIEQVDWTDKFNDIYDAIDALGKKIDKMKVSSSTTPTRKRKVEVDEDDE